MKTIINGLNFHDLTVFLWSLNRLSVEIYYSYTKMLNTYTISKIYFDIFIRLISRDFSTKTRSKLQ